MANASAFNVTEGVGMLQQWGFFNLILPFAIFFFILFGILDKYKIISQKKEINAGLSIAISSFVLAYAYLNNVEEFFSLFYTKMSITLLIILFAITFAVFVYRGMKENEMIPAGAEKAWSGATVFGSFLLMQLAFENMPGAIGEWARQVSGVVLTIGLLGGIASFFASGGKQEGDK